jgi:hypothetical protein
MAGLAGLCEFSIAIVHQDPAIGAAGPDGFYSTVNGSYAQRGPERIATGPLNERHARL